MSKLDALWEREGECLPTEFKTKRIFRDFLNLLFSTAHSEEEGPRLVEHVHMLPKRTHKVIVYICSNRC
jgi:hypothetical protein